MSEHRETAQVDPQVTLLRPRPRRRPEPGGRHGRPEPTPRRLNEQLSDVRRSEGQHVDDEHPVTCTPDT